MKTLTIYEALELLPKASLHTLAVQSVHKYLSASLAEDKCKISLCNFDEAAYIMAQNCIQERIEEARSRYTVADPIGRGWEQYCNFWMALSKMNNRSKEEEKLYSTFTNYMTFALDVHKYGMRIKKQKVKIVELGAGYGFASYAMTCMGYIILGLGAQGCSSWHSWLMDRFMQTTLPVLIKDTYSYQPGNLDVVTEKFGKVDIFCLSGLPIFPALETLAASFQYASVVIFEFLEHIEPGGFLICKSMNFFAANKYTENQRKIAFLELASFFNDIPGVKCLEFGSDKEQKAAFPDAWQGYDLGLILHKQ